MALTLKEILHELAATVGRHYLHESIDQLPDQKGDPQDDKPEAETPAEDSETLTEGGA